MVFNDSVMTPFPQKLMITIDFCKEWEKEATHAHTHNEPPLPDISENHLNFTFQ